MFAPLPCKVLGAFMCSRLSWHLWVSWVAQLVHVRVSCQKGKLLTAACKTATDYCWLPTGGGASPSSGSSTVPAPEGGPPSSGSGGSPPSGTTDYRGSDPIGSDTKGSDPIGNGKG